MSNLAEAYLRNYLKFGTTLNSDEQRIKAFYYLAKYITHTSNNTENKVSLFDLGLVMNDEDLIQGVSTAKFVTYFPIEKRYSMSHPGQTKDYFSTIEMIRKHGIILNNVFEFLWEYQNTVITRYVVRKLCLMSQALYAIQPRKGSLEIIFDEQKKTAAYTLYADEKGEQYLWDNETYDAMTIRKKVQYLKRIK